MNKRVKRALGEVVLDYLTNLYLNDENSPYRFTLEGLREYCLAHCVEHDSQASLNALRDYKESGLIDYECIDSKKGEYQLGFMNICIDTVEGLNVEPIQIPKHSKD